MRSIKLGLVGAAVLALAALANGCSSGYSCSNINGKCSGDQTPTPSDLNRCQSWLNDPICGGAFDTYGTCVLDNEECNDAGAGNFGVATASCPTELNAWQSCCSAHADAGACPLTL